MRTLTLKFIKRNTILKKPYDYENKSFYVRFNSDIDLYKGKIIKRNKTYKFHVDGTIFPFDLEDIKEFYHEEYLQIRG